MVYCSKKSFLGGTLMELTEEVKALLLNTAKDLSGSARRRFTARTVKALGEGGQRLAKRQIGWNHGTIHKGTHQIARRIDHGDGFQLAGPKRSEDHPPHIPHHIT